MGKYSFVTLLILIVLIGIALSQDDKKEEEKKTLSFNLQYEKGMKFSKKVTYSVVKEDTDENDVKQIEATKEVSLRNISIEEVKDNLPTKVKYEFGDTEVYENDKKNEQYEDQLKGHWFKGDVDDELNVAVKEKSDDFPDNKDSKYFFKELTLHGFLRFDFLKSVHKEVNSEWVEDIQFQSKGEFAYDAKIFVKMKLSEVITLENEQFALFTFSLDQCIGSAKITYMGMIKVCVTKNRIVSWDIDIAIQYSKSRKKNYLLSCEFTYNEPNQENENDKKEDVKPKTEEE